MKARILFMALLTFFTTYTFAQTNISGIVTDIDSNEPLAFATVSLKQDGKIVHGISADEVGNYFFEGVDEGKYLLEASYVGFQSDSKVVRTHAEKELLFDLPLKKGIQLKEVEITWEVLPIFNHVICEYYCTTTSCPTRRRTTTNIVEIIEDPNLEIIKSFQLFPNPSMGEAVTVRYERSDVESDRIVQVRMIDITGKQILSMQNSLINGRLKIQLKGIDEMDPGVYFVQIIDNKEALSKRLVIAQ